MQTCSQLEAYLAGRLAPAEAQAFEAHAASCATCGNALTRQRAVERAAKVIRRNQVVRESRGEAAGGAPRSSPYFEPAPSSDLAPLTATTSPDHDAGPSSDTPEPRAQVALRAPSQRRIAAGVLIILTASGALVLWSRGEAPLPQADSHGTDAAPAAANVSPQPEPPAPTPTAPAPEMTAPTPSTTPAPAAETAPPLATDVAGPSSAGSKAAATGNTADSSSTQADFLPIGTDVEVLAEVVASRRCGMAVSALRARVTKDVSDARAWALLTQCYAKRKRWKNAVDAYDKVVEHGDAALIESLQATADAARAELQASADAAIAPAPQ